MNLVVSEMLGMGAKVQNLFKLVRGEALRQFDSLCSDVKITESLNVEYIINGFKLNSPPVNWLSKQKRALSRGTRKPRCPKVRRYSDNLIDLNDYLDWGYIV